MNEVEESAGAGHGAPQAMESARAVSPFHSMNPRVRKGVIGVLERNGAYLVIRRASGVARPGAWCFPGGHVERGETSRAAIRRELQEELGILTDPIQRLGTVRVPESRHILGVWRVVHLEGDIRPLATEVSAYAWCTPAQIQTLADGLASNARVLELLTGYGVSKSFGRFPNGQTP